MPSLSLLKQVSVCARSYEDDGITFKLVNQQEVATNMAFTVVGPFTLQSMIQPLWPQRRIVGDEQQHRLFQKS